jgi:hypothetical protein
MSTFKRRLVRIARFRRATGTYGRRNVGWRLYPPRFEIERKRALELVSIGVRLWLRAEWDCLKHRLRHGRVELVAPPAWRERPASAGDAMPATPEPAPQPAAAGAP